MKKLMMAVVAVCAAVGAFAESTDDYVQSGLIACWDGYENDGEGGHAAETTEWKDTSGQYSFVFNANSGIVVENDRLVFSGASGCCAELSADGTANTFALASDGTVEVVFKADPNTPSTSFVLHSTMASGIVLSRYGSSGSTMKWIVSNKKSPMPVFNAHEDVTTVVIQYAAGVASNTCVNGQVAATSTSDNWSSSGSGTMLGARGGTKASPFKGEVYAIRLYSTPLTPEQIEANHAVDVKRFIEGNVSPPPVYVSGDPENYAASGLPRYGRVESSIGENVELSAPEYVQLAPTKRAMCAGWELYDRETRLLVQRSTDATRLLCAFTYERPVKLVWRWKIQHLLAPVAADGLTVSPTEVWVGEGEEATFTVTGADYPAWTVNGMAQPGRSASITVKGAEGLELSVADCSRFIYVTQDGAGQKDGTSWGNAFDSIQAAVDAAGTEAAVIFLLQGDYTLSTELSIGEGANLVFVGGCTGSGSDVGTVKSALIRDTSVASMRLVNITGATVSFSDMVVRGGRLNPASSYGHGVNSANSALAFTRCTFNDNGVTAGTGNTHRGGGLAANGGSVKLVDCAFTKNVLNYNAGQIEQMGAGIWAKNVALEAAGCLFATNYIYVQHFGGMGGAIYANGGSVLVTNCTFNGNSGYHGRTYDAQSPRGMYGGAIYLDAVPATTIVDSTFDGNYVNNSRGGITEYSGGTIYIAGGKVTVERCKVLRGGWWNGSRTEGGVKYDSGAITLASGDVTVANTLIADGHAYAFEVSGGTLSIDRSTLVGNDMAAILQKGGSVTIANSIVWNNVTSFKRTGGDLTVTYSDIDGGFTGIGNVGVDPLFADTTYYHLKSTAGHCDGGWFAGGAWVTDDESSRLIDTGDPAADAGAEPQPNGHRLNMGYDAGTPAASKTYLGEPAVPTSLAMYIHPLVDAAEDAVTVEGEFGLAANGRATVTVYWGATDGGTDVATWDNDEEIGTASDWTVVSTRLTGLDGKTFMRLKADDGELVAWSAALEYAPVAKATLSDVSITHLMRNTLRAHGTLASDGGAPTSVRIRYWTDDESAAGIVDYNFGWPIAVGESFTIMVDGLEPGVTYHYAIEAVNSVGPNGEVKELTTLSTDPVILYVTTTGAGIEDGSNWANALGSLQDAIDLCTCAGDTLMLAAGTYTTGEQTRDVSDLSRYLVFNAPGLVICGDPAGGTVLHPGTEAVRLLHAKNATITFNDITFRGGRLNGENSYGHGLYGESSTLVFNRCVFDDNGAPAATANGHRGGGLAANGGSVKLNDCTFTKNRLIYNAGQVEQIGAAVWTKNAALEVAGCLFATNYIHVVHYGSFGGAIYANGGSALITNCTFNGNYVMHDRGYDAQMGRPANGGAIYFDAVPSATVVDSTFDGNYANNLRADTSGYHRDYSGGTIFLAGAAGNATIERCKILRGGWWGGSPTEANVKNDNGSICISAGKASVVNTLVTGMHSNAFEVAGGTLAITNVTVVGGDREPVLQKGGTLSVVNSILWDNASETGVSFDIAGGTTEVSHSDMLGGFEGEGNIDKDPKFSTSKRAPVPYWLRTSSPCANTGDASGWTADDIDLLGRPRLRDRFVDMGCYECGSSGLLLMIK